MVKVYSCVVQVQGEGRLDITVKTGDKVFAPTWEMVMKSKAGKMTQQEYTDQYYSIMRQNYHKHRHRWDEVLSLDKVVLVCFCPSGTFCHRLLLAEILSKLGAEYYGEIE